MSSTNVSHSEPNPGTNGAPSALDAVKVINKSTVDYPDFKSKPRPKTADEFIERAKEVAELLALDVAQRDLNNEIPYKQIQLLKDAGLVRALGPVKYGGGGLEIDIGYKIEREVAAGDGSIGQLLGYHYLWSYTAQVVGTPEQADFEAKRYTENDYFYGAAVNPRDEDLQITESEDGKYLIYNGRKAFSTGSKISDLTVLEGVLNGAHIFAITESHQEGIKYGDDWNNVLGMRGTQSGSITITNVRVPWSSALGFVDKQFRPLGAYNTILLPTIQLVFTNFYLGIAQGALAKASRYTVANTRPWPFAGDVKAKGVGEFYVQDIYGSLQAKVWGLEAQVDAAGVSIRNLIHRENRESLTAEERGQTAVRVAAAKVQAIEIGLEVTSKIYEVMGARSISLKAGFDHFWRNIRTHSLHDPVAHKKAEVGRYVLKGELPSPTWYT
ncbi:acyl-CoA dehydrogenase NM domain-like protein [Sistotremastrum niveocremeum HHB9708]|uniref:Acyl-CoA dehydrogenase NM domain-like protein n=1 Tax=Sistotremastrum niveocremeum HHB9708 TaxID=1314777 RepID=A0A164W4T5_9AGAM|nr:acyl-CoA dehydrogenase NM domain-like protein [Sistotremastrum niveocremeum HHB9708]